MKQQYNQVAQKYKEQYRPQFHFTPEENWMNDPNGMVYFNDEYHLFYQHHPFGTTWGPMHWGHAVSKDLIHWEHLPIALFPDEHGTIFSGSAIVDWNNTSGFFDDQPGLVAIYTSADNYPDSDRPRQRQSLAYSIDNGRTWVKYEGNPVLSDVNITDYRDPKVFWHHDTNKWVMVLATEQSVTIYTSPNLIDWEYASEFGNKAGSHDGVWECPDLFQLSIDDDKSNQKWAMLVSIGDNSEFKEGSRTQYFIGQFDGTTFVNDNDDDTILWLDYGRDNYAGVTWSDSPDERRIYIGWMSNWRYANQVPTNEWRSAMTLPRELTMTSTEEGVRLVQKPVSEINKIRKETNIHKEIIIDSNNSVFFDLNNKLMEIEIEFEQINSSEFDLLIQHSETEKTIISYDVRNSSLLVDRTNSGENSFSTSFPAVQEAPLKMKNNKVKLQLFIDTSSIELFANDGEIAMTSLIFPSEIGKGLTLVSNGGSTNVSTLKVTELESIWK
ncbi:MULTISPECIES: glycoside hydrolase family 32 protein [Metabacillus]|uniref:Glycoside hydrolase n=2 Tax=Metabacillus TaxID=2675233 RepID=A0A179T643_9BACI|nr:MULTISPECIES: glycoside hydrolase family 32 protein [Metabacillus]OAS89241.1 glycoside hydrolase [Metabacillus litoralis]QNF28754.1 glycoside hydrolase family 32 protein [Metabacillus sp. KUDC1714]